MGGSPIERTAKFSTRLRVISQLVGERAGLPEGAEHSELPKEKIKRAPLMGTRRLMVIVAVTALMLGSFLELHRQGEIVWHSYWENYYTDIAEFFEIKAAETRAMAASGKPSALDPESPPESPAVLSGLAKRRARRAADYRNRAKYHEKMWRRYSGR